MVSETMLYNMPSSLTLSFPLEYERYRDIVIAAAVRIRISNVIITVIFKETEARTVYISTTENTLIIIIIKWFIAAEA
jgi:hypothetical protein